MSSEVPTPPPSNDYGTTEYTSSPETIDVEGALAGPSVEGALAGPSVEGAPDCPSVEGALAGPSVEGAPDCPSVEGALAGPSVEGAQDCPSKNSCQLDKLQCFYDELTQQNNRNLTELNAQNELLNNRVIADDEIISTLLDKLQENQDKYNQLVNNKNYCPWTWLQNVSNNNYLTYGIVGLIVIIGGSKAIFH